MLKFNYLTVFILLATLQVSCNDSTPRNCNQEPGAQTQIVKIKYGTSFGFCVGYCWKQLTMTYDNIEFEKMSHDEEEPITCDRDFSCSEWVNLSQNIDLKRFFELNEIIGCPDCADGGAEWIEIHTLTSHHKVTFEYMNPPQEIENHVKSLQDLIATFNDCN